MNRAAQWTIAAMKRYLVILPVTAYPIFYIVVRLGRVPHPGVFAAVWAAAFGGIIGRLVATHTEMD